MVTASTFGSPILSSRKRRIALGALLAVLAFAVLATGFTGLVAPSASARMGHFKFCGYRDGRAVYGGSGTRNGPKTPCGIVFRVVLKYDKRIPKDARVHVKVGPRRYAFDCEYRFRRAEVFCRDHRKSSHFTVLGTNLG